MCRDVSLYVAMHEKQQTLIFDNNEMCLIVIIALQI